MENVKAMLEKELPELIAMQQRITKLAEQQLASIDISKASPLDKMRFEEAINKLNEVKKEYGIINNG